MLAGEAEDKVTTKVVAVSMQNVILVAGIDEPQVIPQLLHLTSRELRCADVDASPQHNLRKRKGKGEGGPLALLERKALLPITTTIITGCVLTPGPITEDAFLGSIAKQPELSYGWPPKPNSLPYTSTPVWNTPTPGREARIAA